MRGKHCVELLLLPMACLGAVAAAAQDAPIAASEPNLPSTMFVLDASRTMWTKIGATSKMGLVRISVGQALGDYQDKITFGLVAFGHRPASACGDNQVLAKPGELTPKTQSKLLFGYKPQASETDRRRSNGGRASRTVENRSARHRAHHRRPGQLQGRHLHNCAGAEADLAGPAHPRARLHHQERGTSRRH